MHVLPWYEYIVQIDMACCLCKRPFGLFADVGARALHRPYSANGALGYLA